MALNKMKMEVEEIKIDECRLIEAIEKISGGGTMEIEDEEGKVITIKVKKIPQETVVPE